MHRLFGGSGPQDFMSNFQQSFDPTDDQIMEYVRRISEQEAEDKKKKNKASEDAVKKLPIIKLGREHCKQKEGRLGLEPPTCTVCVEHIKVGTKGMFMPCGHVFHPDCLNPWLGQHNTCPVCRFEIPKEEA